MLQSGRNGAEAIVASIEARIFPILRRVSEEPHMAAVREAMGPSFAALVAVTIIAFFIPPELTLRVGLNAYSARFFPRTTSDSALWASQSRFCFPTGLHEHFPSIDRSPTS